MIAAFALSLLATAQPGDEKRKVPNPELMAKKLTLSLDLDNQQESKVLALLKEQQTFMQANRLDREERRKMTDDQREKHTVAMLEQKIAVKRTMKKILNSDQYERWEKMMAQKGKKRRSRMKKRDH